MYRKMNKIGKLIGLTMGLFVLGLSSASISNASDIAVIGWGSLPWDPQTLHAEGQPGQQFAADGPTLPLAFSRVSKNGRLTLVIDPKTVGAGRKPGTSAGGKAQALHARSIYKFNEKYIYGGETQPGLNCAIQNLREREGSTNKNDIGYVNLVKKSFRMTQLNPGSGNEETIEGKFFITNDGQVKIVKNSGLRKELIPYLKGLITWSTIKGLKATVWTDLQRNFQKKKKGLPYSLAAAKTHLRGLTAEKKATALEYIQRAPVASQIPETNALLAALQGN